MPMYMSRVKKLELQILNYNKSLLQMELAILTGYVAYLHLIVQIAVDSN